MGKLQYANFPKFTLPPLTDRFHADIGRQYTSFLDVGLCSAASNSGSLRVRERHNPEGKYLHIFLEQFLENS